ncbi:hypothetical protein MJH12_06805 [bacterium]|nr:hypothetical protein [bacterium]
MILKKTLLNAVLLCLFSSPIMAFYELTLNFSDSFTYSDYIIQGKVISERNKNYEIRVLNSLKGKLKQNYLVGIVESNWPASDGVIADIYPLSGEFIGFMNSCSTSTQEQYCNIGVHTKKEMGEEAFNEFTNAIEAYSKFEDGENSHALIKLQRVFFKYENYIMTA